MEGFNLPSKLYGNTSSQASRIVSTFLDRPASTGVLLVGEKGSGKTLLSKAISIESRRHEIPTLVINEPWCGEEFNLFIQSLMQPMVIIFDEFEKVYQDEEQLKLLTLFDGMFPSKKLFVFTCNNRFAVNDHFINRPGRIYYSIKFDGIDVDTTRDFCQDNLTDKQHIPEICSIVVESDMFNFDMLKALVEEMNRYHESPKQALSILNITPAQPGYNLYSLKSLTINGQPVSVNRERTDCDVAISFDGGRSLRVYYDLPAPAGPKRPRLTTQSTILRDGDSLDETSKYEDFQTSTDIYTVQGRRMILRNDNGAELLLERPLRRQPTYLAW